MPTLNTTPNRAYQEPFLGNELSIDVGRIISALRAIDVDMASAFAQIVAKASLASPAFTGTPTVPTAVPGTDTNQAASTAFVRAAIAALIDSSPGALDTLNELAAALGDDPNFSTTVLTAIGLKADAAATTAALSTKADASALALKADKAIVITAGTGLTGGGDLSSGRAISADVASQAEAEGGASTSKLLTPQRGRQLAAAYNKWETIEEVSLTAAASYIKTDLAAFYELILDGTLIPSAGVGIFINVSTDNGATWISSSDQTGQQTGIAGGSAANTVVTTMTSLPLSWVNVQTGADLVFFGGLYAFNKARRLRSSFKISTLNTVPQTVSYDVDGWGSPAAPGLVARNALRILPASGTLAGQFTLFGKRG